MYTPRYIQYVNLPQIPEEILDRISRNFDEYRKSPGTQINPDTYWWSDSFNEEINQWGQQNICADMYFAFQAAAGDLRVHKDHQTKIKLSYLLDCGGDNVLTEFFDDQNNKLASYCIEPNRWHIFKADTAHQVINTSPGQIRFSITARIFS